jgi:hypothetical protein
MKSKYVNFLAILITVSVFFGACKRAPENPPLCNGNATTITTSKVIVSGLNDPRGLKFGPDGNLYVAEAGVGGTNVSTQCAQVVPPVGPYMGSNTGSRISRIDQQGIRTTVADNLPSTITTPEAGSGISGVADVAFVDHTLYGLLSGAGCSHGVPDVPNGIFKVNPDKSWKMIANYSQYLMTHPVKNPFAGDFEPDGTAYSMINVGSDLYVVEPNHGELDRISTHGDIHRVIDISAFEGHIVPTCVAYHDGNFYVGNLDLFPIVPGSSSIFKITPSGKISVFAKGFNAILGVAFDDNDRLYVLQCTVGADQLTPGLGNVVRQDPSGKREVITSGLMLPSAMTFGPDGKLYISNWGIGPAGMGEIIQVSFSCEYVRGDNHK